MRVYNIRKRLNIPEYKITEVMSENEKEIHIRLVLCYINFDGNRSVIGGNWFKNKISSAISEGINNKIKRLKRIAYGYKNVEYFKLKIHHHCGLLNPRRYQQ